MKETKQKQSDHIAEIIAELSVEYVDAIPGVVDKIEVLSTQKNIPLIREEFHKLRGTGNTYGLDEITILGQTMERICLEFDEDQVVQFLPAANRVLNKIYSARKERERYAIENDGDYNHLNSFVAIH